MTLEKSTPSVVIPLFCPFLLSNTQALILTGLMFARNLHRTLLRRSAVTSRRSVTTLEGNPHIVRPAILQAFTTNT